MKTTLREALFCPRDHYPWQKKKSTIRPWMGSLKRKPWIFIDDRYWCQCCDYWTYRKKGQVQSEPHKRAHISQALQKCIYQFFGSTQVDQFLCSRGEAFKRKLTFSHTSTSLPNNYTLNKSTLLSGQSQKWKLKQMLLRISTRNVVSRRKIFCKNKYNRNALFCSKTNK